MFNIKEMIQRNEKLLNGMIPRKSGRDAISVGKVSQDEQTVAEGGELQSGQWKCWAACVGRSGPVSCVHVPSNASLLVFPFHCWGPHYFTLHHTTHTAGQGRGVFTGQSPWPLLFFALLCFSLLDILISGTATSKSVQLKVENAACLMLKCVDGRQNLKVHFWI